ncbi:MAG: glycyl-radical enzyme activating protein [Candidatus Heimdallarchaeota archaeon]
MNSTNTSNTKATAVSGLVLEIQKLSTEDGPGIRTSIFLKGCPLRCDWCHNPESIPTKPGLQWFEIKCIGCKSCIDVCPEGSLTFTDEGVQINREKCIASGECVEACPSTALQLFGRYWDLDELFHEIIKDRAYYEKSNGGITISGGEPAMQIDYAVTLLKKCKENNIATAFDTCGYTARKNLKRVLPYVDLFLYDLKEIDSNKHEEFTGVPNLRILENCSWLTKKVKELGKEIWIRTPIIPNYTATEGNIRGIARFIIDELENKVDRWDLLAFNNLATDKYERMDRDWKLKESELLTKKQMEHFYDIALEEGAENVHWSGMTKREEKE